MAVLKYYNTATSAWEYIAASTTANFTTWKKTMAGGETSVSGTDDNAVTLSYTVGLEQVFINGVLQVRGSDYTATTGTSVTGLSTLAVNDVVTVVCYAPFNVANTIAPTVVDAKGDLIAGTAADTVGRLAVGTNGQMLVADSTASTGLAWANAGKVLQVVQARSTTETTIASTSMADTGLSASITCSSNTNKVLVMITQNVYVARLASPQGIEMDLQRNGSTIETFGANGYSTLYLGFAGLTNMNLASYVSYSYLDSPASTSALTYKTRGRIQNTANSGNSIFQWVNSPSTITLMEIKA